MTDLQDEVERSDERANEFESERVERLFHIGLSGHHPTPRFQILIVSRIDTLCKQSRTCADNPHDTIAASRIIPAVPFTHVPGDPTLAHWHLLPALRAARHLWQLITHVSILAYYGRHVKDTGHYYPCRNSSAKSLITI